MIIKVSLIEKLSRGIPKNLVASQPARPRKRQTQKKGEAPVYRYTFYDYAIKKLDGPESLTRLSDILAWLEKRTGLSSKSWRSINRKSNRACDPSERKMFLRESLQLLAGNARQLGEILKNSKAGRSNNRPRRSSRRSVRARNLV